MIKAVGIDMTGTKIGDWIGIGHDDLPVFSIFKQYFEGSLFEDLPIDRNSEDHFNQKWDDGTQKVSLV